MKSLLIVIFLIAPNQIFTVDKEFNVCPSPYKNDVSETSSLEKEIKMIAKEYGIEPARLAVYCYKNNKLQWEYEVYPSYGEIWGKKK